MEFMNKANLRVVASSNFEQQIVKTDIKDKGHTASLTSESLEELGTALGSMGFTELFGRSLHSFTSNTQF